MKRSLSITLAAAILLASAPATRAPVRQCETEVEECVVAALVICVGAVCIVGIWKCCKLLNKLDPQGTNSVPAEPTNDVSAFNLPTLRIASYTPNLTVQSADAVAQPWIDRLHLSLTNFGNAVVVSSPGGALTNSIVNGVAVFFINVPDTNPPPARFFRLLSTP